MRGPFIDSIAVGGSIPDEMHAEDTILVLGAEIANTAIVLEDGSLVNMMHR